MTAHAILGASSSDRWMNCTGSPSLIATVDPELRDQTSPYAEEGSAAHALAEHCVLCFLETGEWLDPYDFKGRRLGRVLDGDYELLPEDTTRSLGVDCWAVDDEMADAVQVYQNETAQWLDQCLDPQVFVEKSVQPLPGRDDLFGTSDLIIVDLTMGVVIVIDFKYGKGHRVQAEENSQAKYYALGALRTMVDVGDREAIDDLHIVIVQPRVVFEDGTRISRWSIKRKELEFWGDLLRTTADITYDEKRRTFVAGEWCRFCSAKALCPAIRNKAYEEAKVAFAENPLEKPINDMTSVEMILPSSDNPEAIARALALTELFEGWGKAVHAMAYHLAQQGVRIPGSKLVRKKTNRRFRDAEKVEKVLKGKKGIKADDIYTKKLKGPAQIEKLEEIDQRWMDKYVEKPEGGLTLVPESDKREAVAPAITAFAEKPMPGFEVPPGAENTKLADHSSASEVDDCEDLL